ncbi:MAG: peptidase [Bacteroidetes bacterium]|nr:MAG: peptidase [Bacteroidota bacterium]
MSGKYNYVEKGHHDNVSTYQHHPSTLDNLAAKIDLRKAGAFPPVFDQKNLNSCTANAISAALYFDMVKQKVKDVFIPSRLFIYYNEREIEGKVDNNAPVSMKDCIATISKNGYCSESMWPYDVGKFADKPPQTGYDFAKSHKAVKTHKLPFNLDHLKACIHEGIPFVFGFKVYEQFESAETKSSGKIPMPKPDEKMIGGHAVLAVGYDDQEEHFIIRNSFGSSWGDEGYGYMPYNYISSLDKLAFDFWVVQKVVDKDDPGSGLSNNKGCMSVLLSIF